MKRLTERRGDGVRYVQGRYEITCYPKNDNLSDIDKMAVRLCELEDKLESGQLKEINYPCNVGDKVYVICSQTSNDKNLYIREDICNDLRVTKNETGSYWLWVAFKGDWSVFEWLFDRVFHTPEEAEAKLKELQEGKG